MHVLLKCEARSYFSTLRATFQQDITNRIIGDGPWKFDLLEQLVDLLHDQRLTERTEKYIFVVLEVFSSVAMFIPLAHTYL